MSRGELERKREAQTRKPGGLTIVPFPKVFPNRTINIRRGRNAKGAWEKVKISHGF